MKNILRVILNALFLISLLTIFACLIIRIWIIEKELVDNIAWTAFFTLMGCIIFHLLIISENKPKRK